MAVFRGKNGICQGEIVAFVRAICVICDGKNSCDLKTRLYGEREGYLNAKKFVRSKEAFCDKNQRKLSVVSSFGRAKQQYQSENV